MFGQQIIRMFSRTTIKRSSHGYEGGQPGVNFPMNLNGNKYWKTLLFTLFFGSGLALPFLVVKHQMSR